jgi:hypothetical protein
MNSINYAHYQVVNSFFYSKATEFARLRVRRGKKVGFMKKLILHPTDTSQWHALVNEAQVACQSQLDEELESYLVFLLMRYSQTAKLIESVVATDFLESMKFTGNRRVDALRDVGDKSLLFCGLFPGIADKRRVSIDYYMDVGQSAYLSASENVMQQWSQLFINLSEDFETLKQILTSMRSEYLQLGDIDLMQGIYTDSSLQ